MLNFSQLELPFTAEPLATSSTGFGEFVLRAGIGMGSLAIFVALCCVAWNTVPFLKALVPEFFKAAEEKPAKASSVLINLKPVSKPVASPLQLIVPSPVQNTSAEVESEQSSEEVKAEEVKAMVSK